MKRKHIFIMLFLALSVLFLISKNSFATLEEETNEVDNIAPVFSNNIQKRYVLKKSEDGSVFLPENIIKDISAIDNIDGKNVDIKMVDQNVDLSQDGIYQVLYTATDKAGNSSVICIEIIVDGIKPTFNENIEKLYYINHSGIIFDSKKNVIEKLPEMITATDALGAYAGIGIYLADINDNIVFVQKIENTPAYELLEKDDILINVDGEDVRGKTAAYAASKIKGQEGTSVTLKILRNGKEKIVTIKREIIKLYGEEDCIAEPNIDITNIDIQNNGVIEITYTAEDQAGNISTITIQVVINNTDEDMKENDQETDVEEAEIIEDKTTGDNPPDDKELNVEEEYKTEIIDTEDVVTEITGETLNEHSEEKTIE